MINDETTDRWQITEGRLLGAEWLASPNFGKRPSDMSVSLLVIHNISLPPGQFGGGFIQAFFQNQLDHAVDPYFEGLRRLEVSSHLLIERSGHIVQFVNFNDRAWHAGKSTFQGRSDCNDFSIGIELEGTDHTPYTEQQYQQLARVTQTLMHTYPAISTDRITGHCDIAPGRKTDPGEAFDWQYYRQLIALDGSAEAFDQIGK